MTATAENVSSALEMVKAESHLHPEGSYDVSAHSVPTGREEIWRFTPLKRLRGLHSDAVFAPSTVSTTWTAPESVRVERVDGEDAKALRGISGLVPNTLFGARILDEVPDSLLVDVPANTELDTPVFVDLMGKDAQVVEAGHVALRFGAHSRATVVLNHTGSTTLAQVVEVKVGDGAQVSVISLQDWADDTVHLTHHEALVGRDASYRHVAISFGGERVAF